VGGGGVRGFPVLTIARVKMVNISEFVYKIIVVVKACDSFLCGAQGNKLDGFRLPRFEVNGKPVQVLPVLFCR
jgi:hypothetical protein